MARRKDGLATRERILAAAAEVFSRNGFRDTIIADVAEAAGANTASIHYHFSDKESLYREVWRMVVEESLQLYP